MSTNHSGPTQIIGRHVLASLAGHTSHADMVENARVEHGLVELVCWNQAV